MPRARWVLLAALSACGVAGVCLHVWLPRPCSHGGYQSTSRVRLNCSNFLGARSAVLILAGQSNAASFGSGAHHSDLPHGVIGNLNHHDGECYDAAPPLLGADTWPSGGDSPWIRVAGLLIRNGYTDRVLLAPIAVGGSPIAWWASASALPRARCGAQFARALGALRARGLARSPLVLWHQGEADHGRALSYTDAFLRMRDNVEALMGGGNVSWVVAQASRCGAQRSDPALLRAQGALSGLDGVFAGPNTDLVGASLRYDGCHFSAAGLDAVASAWFERLRALAFLL